MRLPCTVIFANHSTFGLDIPIIRISDIQVFFPQVNIVVPIKKSKKGWKNLYCDNKYFEYTQLNYWIFLPCVADVVRKLSKFKNTQPVELVQSFQKVRLISSS